MRRMVLITLMAVLLPSLVLAQDDRNDKRGDGDMRHHAGHVTNHNFNQRHNAKPNVYKPQRAGISPQFKNLGVRSYPKPYAHQRLLVTNREHSTITLPTRGPGNIALHANVFARTNFSANPTVRAHMSVIVSPAFRTQINLINAHETRVGFYYWHTGNGFNYCHYYDPWGYHWYGWYLGDAYFWTRWFSNNWWWYDPAYYRWCYWHDGGWWWQDPDTTTIYVYNNGSYLPADNGANVNVNVNGNNGPEAPSAAAPVQAIDSKNIFYSKDSTRKVKLVGSDAFLYDVSGQNSFKPVFLGSNVTSVKFSNTSNGKPLQVMLFFKDGTFGLFDGQGNPLNGANNSSN